MKNKQPKRSDKTVEIFNTIFIIGVFFTFTKMIDYLQWTFQLIKKWELPNEPFFSKINIINSSTNVSVTAYLMFAVSYIFAFAFIILGLYALNKTKKLFSEQQFFNKEVGLNFKKAGNYFFAFVIAHMLIDIVFLAWSKTSSKAIDLLSTKQLIFLVLGFLMFFLSEVFKKITVLKDDNNVVSTK